MKSKLKHHSYPFNWLLAGFLVLVLAAFITGCQSVPSSEPSQVPTLLNATSTSVPATQTSTEPPPATESVSSPTPDLTATQVSLTPTYDPSIRSTWKLLPAIPETFSERVHQIYLQGQERGLNRYAFSKIGDCETQTTFFLNLFDCCKNRYVLGEYEDLAGVIQYFEGSYSRTSLAAGRGFRVASVLTSFWSDPEQCKPGQNPVVCEIEIHRPAFALVMFGTNDVVNSIESFEDNMRILLDEIIARDVVPILATKADNLEGDESINAAIAYLAYEYEIPLWNLWRDLQELPNGGLQEDMVHLTYADPLFDDPEVMLYGWPVRNLSALQMLDRLMQEFSGR